MKTLVLIRGVSGSGKSTLAESLSENGKYPILSADMYFEDSNGNYNWDATKLKDAHDWCRIQVRQLMVGVENSITRPHIRFPNRPVQIVISTDKIFVANTFTQEWEVEPYFELAEKYGYTVFSIIVENRHGNQNTHNVPDEKVQQMKDRFQIKL